MVHPVMLGPPMLPFSGFSWVFLGTALAYWDSDSVSSRGRGLVRTTLNLTLLTSQTQLFPLGQIIKPG